MIAGAGIIGLATALELAMSGFQVTVVERGHAMEQSSWAAAGMLAVDDPENTPELLPLARLSRALYPEFLARIEQLSGLAVPLRTRQTLQGHVLREPGTPSLPPSVLPDLSTARHRFTLLEEASLDPRDLCTALPIAVRAAGVRLLEGNAVCTVACSPGSVAVTLADGSIIEGNAFVIAAGAWSGSEVGHRTSLPIAPRKGQMIEVTLDRANPSMLPLVVRTPELYLVPRGDGRVTIGATVEYAGFDRCIDEAAGDRLWEAAAALWPPVRQARITARWTGLRPGFRAGITDAMPVIGQLEDGIWAATGHFRNGILLAPGTARLICEMLGGKTTSIPVEAFQPSRFSL